MCAAEGGSRRFRVPSASPGLRRLRANSLVPQCRDRGWAIERFSAGNYSASATAAKDAISAISRRSPRSRCRRTAKPVSAVWCARWIAALRSIPIRSRLWQERGHSTALAAMRRATSIALRLGLWPRMNVRMWDQAGRRQHGKMHRVRTPVSFAAVPSDMRERPFPEGKALAISSAHGFSRLHHR